ncbi:hypothetical protein L861_16735 [Litchfieldella anticariensis FP35 = DSM 16096]|uniref:HTH gntR-type domain-containing protein n=1 Tax=Litchfieldella anticariensis (strain DSM 16096 / CECT 5854 / CIP 108499 / LMG 22089 / FP35) TaxID=1121939 RepID=S2KHC8_LITA3|nr:LysR family transcriptional regulator [Halomonas anticariensis]EPC01517.1 hypothetical protein L861_16735 [Halomonas anticariensis FP35 = DSM 16096]
MTRPTLADLEAFAAVAAERNFRRAADLLGISRSALSHRMRKLEEQLGVRLLNRTTRSVSLTDSGSKLLARIAPTLRELDSTLDTLANDRGEPSGLLRINASNLMPTSADMKDDMAGSASRRLPYHVADTIKGWIVDRQLMPGDRLPGEAELMKTLGVSKGTIRESTRVLEAQGLVKTRPGPGGGVFVCRMSEAKATSLLSHYLYFQDISIRDIYQIRLALEPELAASLAGKVSADDLGRLRESLHSYATPAPDMEVERQQHIDSLRFHEMLAKLVGGNPLLSFIIRFTVQVLSDLTVYQRLYEPGDHQIGPTGCRFHAQILDAIEEGNADLARKLMREHMLSAQAVMNDNEAQMRRGFLNG